MLKIYAYVVTETLRLTRVVYFLPIVIVIINNLSVQAAQIGIWATAE